MDFRRLKTSEHRGKNKTKLSKCFWVFVRSFYCVIQEMQQFFKLFESFLFNALSWFQNNLLQLRMFFINLLFFDLLIYVLNVLVKSCNPKVFLSFDSKHKSYRLSVDLCTFVSVCHIIASKRIKQLRSNIFYLKDKGVESSQP